MKPKVISKPLHMNVIYEASNLQRHNYSASLSFTYQHTHREITDGDHKSVLVMDELDQHNCSGVLRTGSEKGYAKILFCE